MATDQRETTGSGLAFLSGVLMGAIAGVLLAPQAGRETRKRLQDYAKRGKEELEELTEDTREHMKDAIRSGKEAIRAEKERLLGEKHHS